MNRQISCHSHVIVESFVTGDSEVVHHNFLWFLVSIDHTCFFSLVHTPPRQERGRARAPSRAPSTAPSTCSSMRAWRAAGGAARGLRGARPLSTRARDQPAGAGEGEGDSRQTHFGFQTVDEQDKWKKVHEVFETVADKYDVMNDAMSLGIHRVWKDIFMHRLAPTHGTKLLDVAGGTGDISFRYLNYLKNSGTLPKDKRSHVTVCDINQAMLDVGKVRSERLGYTSESGMDIHWLCADAEKLPLPDDSFTAYTIAFGIRNCTHVDKVLEEAYRVLQSGGRFMCLEFSHLENAALQWVYDKYSFEVIPVLGQVIAGQWKPYQYLVESIRQFPNQEKFKSMIEDAGFRQVTYENLTFGVCSIHSGFKI